MATLRGTMSACVGVLLLCGSYAAHAKVVGIWLLDEGKGDVARDASGAHADDGKVIGGAKWDNAGKVGGAVRFDGATGHIEVPDPKNRLTPPRITLMAWIKAENLAGNHSILEQYDWAGDFGCHAFRTTGAQLQLWVIWGPAGDNVAGGAIAANEWTHVASTYDGAAIRLFINGKGVAEGKSARGSLKSSTKSLSIGVRGDTKDTHWFAGMIDEVAIFDEALSEKDISAITTSSAGLGGLYLAVSPSGKIATTWATLRTAN